MLYTSDDSIMIKCKSHCHTSQNKYMQTRSFFTKTVQRNQLHNVYREIILGGIVKQTPVLNIQQNINLIAHSLSSVIFRLNSILEYSFFTIQYTDERFVYKTFWCNFHIQMSSKYIFLYSCTTKENGKIILNIRKS